MSNMDERKMKDIATSLSRKYGYLPYMIMRYLEMFGLEETKEFLESNERGLKPSIRINTLLADTKKLLIRMKEKGFRFKRVPWTNYGFWVLREPFSLGATPEYLMGYYFKQNAASMIPPEVLEPKKSELVLDMCAAPGAKTTQIAQLMGNEGTIVAVDISPKRVRSLIFNLMRCGVENTIVFNMNSRFIGRLGIKFDKVLLDAPCTGEGLIPIKPERKKSRSIDDIKFMSKVQLELLKSASSVLSEGGCMVYSTCSIAPEENEFVIDEFLRENANFSVVPMDLVYGTPGFTEVFGRKLNDELEYSRRFYPHKNSTIGFFVCKIVKD
ncbi:MAG: NOL1/NOP2/sun family putative RNA methylase [Candidatus Asgardarchaeia archaeon]